MSGVERFGRAYADLNLDIERQVDGTYKDFVMEELRQEKQKRVTTEPEPQSTEFVHDRQIDGCYRAKGDEELRQGTPYRSATRVEQHSLQIVLDDREGQRNYMVSIVSFDGLEWNWIWWPAQCAK